MQSLFTINCNDYPIRVCGILNVLWCEAGTRRGHYNCWCNHCSQSVVMIVSIAERLYMDVLWCEAGTRRGHYNCWCNQRAPIGCNDSQHCRAFVYGCSLVRGWHKARPLQLLMQSLFTINCNDYPIRVCGILDVRWCEAVHKARPLQLLMQSLFTINCNDYPIRVCGILDVRWCEAVPRAGLANDEPQKGICQWVLLK